MERNDQMEHKRDPQQIPAALQGQAPAQQERPMRREQAQSGAESIGQTVRVIDAIERTLSDAYRVPLRKNMCVVDASEMADLIGQLRIALPKSVTQAQSVLTSSQRIIDEAKMRADKTADDADKIYNDTVTKARKFKDEIEAEAEAFDKETRRRAQEDANAILADANTRAEQIVFAAQQQAQKLVDENEISRRAQAYAMETRERAEKDADSIYTQACVHVDKMLSGAAAALSRSASELAGLRDSLLGQGQQPGSGNPVYAKATCQRGRKESQMNVNNTLYIVVPCYKEPEVLPETSRRLKEKVLALRAQGKISDKSRIMFVNDGSSDNTWPIIRQLHEQEPDLFSGVNLSRNRGHQNALLAGLLTAVNYADMIISMDADLQDDINAVDAMVDHYHEGYEVVYGVRSKRDTDTFFKRFTAEGFYKVMKALGVDIVFNHADYRLMSRRAVEGLAQFGEVNLFLRGIVPQIGYKWTTVTYERAERFAGESKYPLKKMLAFAADGITSFSVKPIRMVFSLGVVVFLVSLVMLLYALVAKLTGHTSAGWTSLMGSIWLIGGIQLLSLGVVGEYVGKIYKEAKHRPRFIIESVLNK